MATLLAVDPEDPEVEAEQDGSDTANVPFDPSEISIIQQTMSLDIMIKRMSFDELELNPDFQRNEVWGEEARSRLIESFLIRMPIPAFYFDVTDDQRWVVIDGLQRLSTLRRFVLGKPQQLRLSRLEFLAHLEGKTFQELDRAMQRRIEETQVTVYLVQPQTPRTVKFNLFRRLNTYAKPLNRQEMRNALFVGEATRFLSRLARHEAFQRATAPGISPTRMVDQEFVLRFMAARYREGGPSGDETYDDYLNNAMFHLNRCKKAELSSYERAFVRGLDRAHAIFGADAFRKPNLEGDGRRRPLNKALFESWTVALAELEDKQAAIALERKREIAKLFVEEFSSSEVYRSSISAATSHATAIRTRFGQARQIIDRAIRGGKSDSAA